MQNDDDCSQITDPREYALHAIKLARIRARDRLPCMALTQSIISIATQRKNPLPVAAFANLYFTALRALDPNSLLRVGVSAYFDRPAYANNVIVKVNATRARPLQSRVYDAYEIRYKWSIAVMMATFMPILEEIILVHKYATVIDMYIAGAGCEKINNGSAEFRDFTAAYEMRYKRAYLTDASWTFADAADYIYRMTLTHLGSHVTRDDGITAQNIPRDRPNYTAIVQNNMDCLDLVKRKILASVEMPIIRNGTMWGVPRAAFPSRKVLRGATMRQATPHPVLRSASRPITPELESSSDSDDSTSDSESDTSSSSDDVSSSSAGSSNSSLSSSMCSDIDVDIHIVVRSGNLTINLAN